MKRKHSQWIIFMIIAQLVILGVLSENDGTTVAKVTSETENEAKSETAEGENNIPVDPGGLKPDPQSQTTKESQSTISQDELDGKRLAVETDKDKGGEKDENPQRSNKSEIEKNSDELPASVLADSESGTASISDKDIHKKTKQSLGESVNHVEEQVVKSDDQTIASVNPSETEDTEVPTVLSATPTLEDSPASHTLQTPGSEVVDSSTEVESMDTNKSEEKTDSEPVAVDPEFQTFTEFFEENKQAEEEKKKQSKLTDMPGTDVLQIKQQKRVVNVASRECGAKIISSNPEAENPGGVLTSNKDDYMINPCKAAKKWFVIELCEPARVKSLEVASFELFSSQPHTFRVQFSEVYPTKDWQVMEPFSAKEARAIQNFNVPEDFNDYIKFVRVEMLDHFGEEHFCPLTIFRVLGVLVEYDAYMGQQIDDATSDMDTAMVGDVEDMNGDSDGPKNLFASATESVIKIVKKVLNVEHKASKEDQRLNNTLDANDTEIANVTGTVLPDNMTSDGYMLPCVPDHIEGDVLKQSIIADQPNTPIPGDTGTQSAIKQDGGSGSVGDKSASIVTKLEDHEQVPSSQEDRPIVTLLDREESEVPLLNLVNKCLTKTPRQTLGSKKKLISTKRSSLFCTYVQILLRNSRPGTCAVKRIIPAVRPDVGGQDVDSVSSERKVENSFIIVTKDVLSETSTNTVSNTTGSNSTQSLPPSQTASSLSVHALDDLPIDTSTKPDIGVDTSSQPSSPTPDNSVVDVVLTTVLVPVATEAGISIEPSKVVSDEEVSVTVSQVEETQGSKVTTQQTLTPGEVTLDPSIVTASVLVDSSQTTPALDSGTVIRSQVEESKSSDTTINQPAGSVDASENIQNQNTDMEMSSTKTEIVSTKVSMATEPPSTSDSMEIFDSEAEVMSSIVDKLASAILDDPENGHSRIINDTVIAENTTKKSPGMAQKDLGLVNVKAPVLSYSKREIALMRLANRINALEMNVTLSIRFLERMSQKFKTKSDEMIKALNKTDTKLEETVLEAKAKVKEQDEHMKNMEIRLRNLTVMMEEMIHNMDTLNQKVTDRQMVWTSVEVFILIVIFMVCLKRGKPPSYLPMPPEFQKLLENFPPEEDLTALPRRNSFHGMIKHNSADLAMGSLQKYNSETALSCTRQDVSSFDPTKSNKDSSGINQQKDMPKRKKRKKKSPEVKTCDVAGSSGFKDGVARTEPHTNFNSAGLLFGASPGETTVCENLNKTNSQSCTLNSASDNNLVCQPEDDPTYCKSTYSDTPVNSKGQGPKVKVSSSTNDIQVSAAGGNGNRLKAKAHSFTNELPVSVISSKPPKCPGAPQGGVKSKRGSPPMIRALADPGGGGAAKKKRQNLGHSIPPENSTQTQLVIETVRPNINGNHVSSSLTTDSDQQYNKQSVTQHRPKKKSHTRASSADLTSSSSGVDTSGASWKKLIGWK